MELTYSVTAEDYWQFITLLTRKTPSLWLRWIVAFTIIPLFAFYALWTMGSLVSGTVIFVWVGLCLGWFLFLPWNVKRKSLQRFRQVPGPVGLRSLQIDPTALISSSDLVQTRLAWKAIVRVWDSPVGVLFFYTKLQAILVPNSAFTITNQRENLVQLATAYWRHAQFGDPLPDLPPLGPDTSVWPPPPRTQLQA